MRTYHCLFALAASILLAGCAVPGKYTWGNYDRSLYTYYKDPTKTTEYLAAIEDIIQSAGKTQGKVPPGIYAEYGYFLMKAGKSTEAITQFEMEKVKWPESTQMMNAMIKIATTQPTKPLSSKE